MDVLKGLIFFQSLDDEVLQQQNQQRKQNQLDALEAEWKVSYDF